MVKHALYFFQPPHKSPLLKDMIEYLKTSEVHANEEKNYEPYYGTPFQIIKPKN